VTTRRRRCLRVSDVAGRHTGLVRRWIHSAHRRNCLRRSLTTPHRQSSHPATTFFLRRCHHAALPTSTVFHPVHLHTSRVDAYLPARWRPPRRTACCHNCRPRRTDSLTYERAAASAVRSFFRLFVLQSIPIPQPSLPG